MSTVAPGPVAPPNPLPWEARESRGLVGGFFDTLGLLVSRPAEAWARMRESGDTTSPLLFGIAVCWLSAAVQGILIRVVGMPMLPAFLERRVGRMGGFMGVALVGKLIVLPIVLFIGLLLGAAILHVCCMLVGALRDSRSGFEGTLRAVCYSEVSSIASIVPVVGPPVAIVWWIVLAVQGIERLHHTTSGRAVAAVLIPVVVFCGLVALVVVVLGVAFLTRYGHR